MLRMVANLREDEFSLCWLELIFFLSLSLSFSFVLQYVRLRVCRLLRWKVAKEWEV